MEYVGTLYTQTILGPKKESVSQRSTVPTATSMGICVCVLHEELMELYNQMFPRQMVFNIFKCLVQVEGGSVARL